PSRPRKGRWGEKVPAAVGTVADRFALVQSGALHLKRALLPADDTEASAVGARPLLTQSLGLLFQESLQGALGESGGGRVSDLLHGPEIDIETRSLIAEGTAGDDLTPPGSEVVEFLEFL